MYTYACALIWWVLMFLLLFYKSRFCVEKIEKFQSTEEIRFGVGGNFYFFDLFI